MDPAKLQDQYPDPNAPTPSRVSVWDRGSNVFEKGYPFFRDQNGGITHPLKGCLFDSEWLNSGVITQTFFKRQMGQKFEHYPAVLCKMDADTNMQQPGQITVPQIFRIEGLAIGLPTELAAAQRDRLLDGKMMVIVAGNRIVSDIPLALIPQYPPEDPSVRKIDDRGYFPTLYKGQGVLAACENLETMVRWADPLQLDRFVKMKVFLCGTLYTPM